MPLEQRLAEAERRATAAAGTAGQAEAAAAQATRSAAEARETAEQSARRPIAENAFNPAISLILSGTYTHLSADPNTYRIDGFVPSLGEIAPPQRSFSLGESELPLSAGVDPYFRGYYLFLQFGIEGARFLSFPGTDVERNKNGLLSGAAFAKIGGDVGVSSSWQIGLSFEAAQHVRLLEVPVRLDRAEGDVHPGGNPHIHTDARNFLNVGAALTTRMVEIDPANAAAYQAGWKRFGEKWRAAIARWEAQAAPLKGVPIVVQHQAFPYLNDWLGMREIAALEPKPGVEPTSAHLARVVERLKVQPAKMVIRPAYQSDTAARWIAERTGIPAVVLPFTVGGTPEAKDLYALFDDTVNRLVGALR